MKTVKIHVMARVSDRRFERYWDASWGWFFVYRATLKRVFGTIPVTMKLDYGIVQRAYVSESQ